MPLKIVYLLTCRVLGLAVVAFHSDRAKDTELLVLRHEAMAAGRGPGLACECVRGWPMVGIYKARALAI